MEMERANIQIKPQDLSKIIEHIWVPTKFAMISLNTLRQKMNLLDPSYLNPLAPATQQEVKSMIDKLPDKIKNDMIKINNYLKSKKIDIFECFDKMDVDGDGTISKKEFIDVLLKEYAIPEITREWLSVVFDAIDKNKTGDISIGEMLMYI